MAADGKHQTFDWWAQWAPGCNLKAHTLTHTLTVASARTWGLVDLFQFVLPLCEVESAK